MNNGHNKIRRGFTLLELLISASIFAIVVVVCINLFFTIVKLQKRTSNVQDVQGDSSVLIEEMARELRIGHIDYDYYADPNRDGDTSDSIAFSSLRDPSNNNVILVTRDQDDNQYFFQRKQEGTQWLMKLCTIDAETEAINKCDDVNIWQNVTPESVKVDKFMVFVYPEIDPFEYDYSLTPPDYLSNNQPRVTIVIKTSTISEDKKIKFESQLQTTVSSRIYIR